MSKETLKSLLLRDKGFLKNLYDGPNPLKNRLVLNGASDSEIVTLLRYLYFVTNGIILLNKDNFRIIKGKKKVSILRKYFEKKSDFNTLLTLSRTEKVKILFQLSCVMPNLLYGLFNLEN